MLEDGANSGSAGTINIIASVPKTGMQGIAKMATIIAIHHTIRQCISLNVMDKEIVLVEWLDSHSGRGWQMLYEFLSYLSLLLK